MVGSRLYGAPLPTSDTDTLVVGEGADGAWSPARFLARAAHGFPVAVQALFAPAQAISVGEPLVALRPLLVGKPMLAGLASFLDAAMDCAADQRGWSRQLWQAVVIATMLDQLSTTGTLILPFPTAPTLLALRDHPQAAWAYLQNLEGASHGRMDVRTR